MKLDFRLFAAAAVLILAPLFLITMLASASFRLDVGLVALIVLAVGAGAIALRLMSAGRLIMGDHLVLRRDMDDNFYRRQPEGGSAKSHRTFASAAGGHVARLAAGLKQLVGHGAGGRMRLMMAQ
ncbi:MAG: hypothetical protein RLZZ360_878 [Candidatus Parcubacteria bacterium]